MTRHLEPETRLDKVSYGVFGILAVILFYAVVQITRVEKQHTQDHEMVEFLTKSCSELEAVTTAQHRRITQLEADREELTKKTDNLYRLGKELRTLAEKKCSCLKK